MAVALRITGFSGIVPRQAPRTLPERGAQAAANVTLTSGELVPMRKSREVFAPEFAETVRSFYRVDDTTWFAWGAERVRVERAPIEGPTRFVYTGDGVPKLTTLALALPVTASGTPAAARTLGVASPVAAPSVGHSGGSGAADSRYYVYTFVSDLNEESSPSPVSTFLTGKVDGTWAITGMTDTPPNSGTVSGATAGVDYVEVTLEQAHYMRVGDLISFDAVAGMTDLNGTWAVTQVPSTVKVRVAVDTAQTYTSGGTWARPVPWAPCTKRLYRTSGSSGDFQLVAEGISGTSYNDTLADSAIPGDSLVSDGWTPPPVDLVGLVQLPGGVLAGYRAGGRTICLSEPYQPHAWPTTYQMTVADDVMGLAVFDQNLGVATKGRAVIIAGSEPGQMLPIKHELPLPCVSADSVAGSGDAMLYASSDGLARVTLAQASIFTRGLFADTDWAALSPSTMVVTYIENTIVVGCRANGRLYLIDLSDATMREAYAQVTLIDADAVTGKLYTAIGGAVYEFEPDDTPPLTLDWWSREMVLGKPVNLGAARLDVDESYTATVLAAIEAERAQIEAANAAEIAGASGARGALAARRFNANTWAGSALRAASSYNMAVTFSLYVGGRVVFSKAVPANRTFRLPAGYRADTCSVRVQANTRVRAIVIGETPAALENA